MALNQPRKQKAGKRFRVNETFNFAGQTFKASELVEALYLSGMALDDIASLLRVDAKAFRKYWEGRLKEFETIIKALLVNAAYRQALNGSDRLLELLLKKEGFIKDDSEPVQEIKPWIVQLAPGVELKNRHGKEK